ncbi:RNA polymerase sigma factor SigM [Actinomycetospora corticicola]|uniref:RNA polymerase sigma-70 factor (ECF subfamily) n=1 Tax=Actinomycetospora corticicola TaxID=663602 RepID=A0A7Y9E211_9PSEU|nr:sigma-70 family RNA polymerase sigma factor [Actinomycetospora corticicola]NYD39701.1 RNA polymerase sigma-70 factor (ECF subfamily) [Actinomycetospora corticicola]
MVDRVEASLLDPDPPPDAPPAGAAAGSAASTRPAPRGPGDDPDVDRWLVGRVVAGDVEAYEELLRRHRDRIYRIALRVLADPADADDVTQDIAIQLWTGLSSFTGSAAFTTWLYRVVVNRCLNLRRRRRRTEELTEATHPTAPGPEARVVAGQELEAGIAALADMPEELRVALVLIQLEGLSYAQAAAVLKVPEATVRGRLARGRAQLVKSMRSWS